MNPTFNSALRPFHSGILLSLAYRWGWGLTDLHITDKLLFGKFHSILTLLGTASYGFVRLRTDSHGFARLRTAWYGLVRLGELRTAWYGLVRCHSCYAVARSRLQEGQDLHIICIPPNQYIGHAAYAAVDVLLCMYAVRPAV